MKKRLDLHLVQLGLAPTREQAKRLIADGWVVVNGKCARKAGDMVSHDAAVDVRGGQLRYVSRGGLKLEKAVEAFGLKLDGAVCMDVGASTGGFTDCMLQNGAAKVYAVDVGSGQLAPALAQDVRVVNLENTNIRQVTRLQVPETIAFASIDVAFISLKLVLPVVWELLAEEGAAVALIKPQFEAGPGKVGKKGVVKDPNTHAEVVRQVLSCANALGFGVQGLTFSPIRGPEGNIEYLAYLKKHGQDVAVDVERIVEQSHQI